MDWGPGQRFSILTSNFGLGDTIEKALLSGANI